MSADSSRAGSKRRREQAKEGMDYLKLLEQSPFRGQTVDQSVVKEVVRTLLRVNVCARCILRCVNCCKPSDLKSRVLLRDLHLW